MNQYTALNVSRHEVHNRATVYAGYAIRMEDGQTLVALLTGWTGNSGQWVRLNEDSVSWDYLVEKVPAIAKYPGDKEGFVLLFKEMGVEVFN